MFSILYQERDKITNVIFNKSVCGILFFIAEKQKIEYNTTIIRASVLFTEQTLTFIFGLY